jgi:hypothetical protein
VFFYYPQVTFTGYLFGYIIKINMVKQPKEPIERLIVKIPKSLAEYFRTVFPHGKRSDFFAECIKDYRLKREIEVMEDKLRAVNKKRQKV